MMISSYMRARYCSAQPTLLQNPIFKSKSKDWVMDTWDMGEWGKLLDPSRDNLWLFPNWTLWGCEFKQADTFSLIKCDTNLYGGVWRENMIWLLPPPKKKNFSFPEHILHPLNMFPCLLRQDDASSPHMKNYGTPRLPIIPYPTFLWKPKPLHLQWSIKTLAQIMRIKNTYNM